MKHILNKLYNHELLTKTEAKTVLIDISNGKVNDAQIASFITVYLMRSITVEELQGFKEALLELAVPFDTGGQDTIDLCGTGGDGKNTFNISTLSSFVVAGAGYKVVKHGNYGVSSVSGSSNVIEALGYTFTNDSSILSRQLEQANICFCHAPLFHPALKGVGPIRRNLGVKTFFNMLGPLVNPAQTSKQLVGVFSLKLARLYKHLFDKTNKDYKIVYSLDGYDEISLTSDAVVISRGGDHLLRPHNFDSQQLTPDKIYGGNSVAEALKIFKSVLHNESTSDQKQVVIANSALAIQCFDPDKTLASAIHEAEESINSGRALHCLTKLINLSK